MTSATMTAAEGRAYYLDKMTLREARTAYFARTGFDDGTYVDTWVKLPVGPIHVYMPNVGPRREAVKIHDINHIVGGFGTDWQGEFEISAFELGMGTGRYWVGWFLGVGGVALGLLRCRDPVRRAFARGRRTKASIYREIPDLTDAVLDGTTVGALRERVQIPDEATPTPEDDAALKRLAVMGVLLHVVLPLLGFVGVLTALFLAVRSLG